MADVEKMPEDITQVRQKFNDMTDEEFISSVGLKGAKNPALGKFGEGDDSEEVSAEGKEATADEGGDAEAESQEAVQAEKEAEPESREARRTKAEAFKRGQREPVKEEAEEGEVKAEEKGKEEAVEEEVAEKEGEAEKVEEEKPFLTTFTLKQGSQETEIPRDVTLDFTANKKEYKDVPLDKVVLWAQMGVYNEAREAEVTNAKKYVSEVTNYNKQLETSFQNLKGEVDSLLGDEAYYEAARTQWLRNNSPEERARRAEETLRQQRQNETKAEQTRQAQGYIQNEIFPAVEQILKAHKVQ